MNSTEIFELKTEEDVVEFCRQLLQIKGLGPKSVHFTMAVTVSRQVSVREPYDEEEEKRGPIESGFRKLVRA